MFIGANAGEKSIQYKDNNRDGSILEQSDIVSVIVPIYNSEKTISRCIESIQLQKYKNLEIILIDDGSTDGSGEICDKYETLDRRIRCIHKENGGVSSARNTGLNVATGAYVMFCDSDDTVDPLWVYEMHKVALLGDYTMVLCPFSGKKNNQHEKKLSLGDYTVYEKDNFYSFFRDGQLGSVVNKIFKRNIIGSTVRFNEDLSYGEDKIFALDYMLATEGPFLVRYLKDVLYFTHSDRQNRLSQQFGLKRQPYLALEEARLHQIGHKFSIPQDEVEHYLRLKKDIVLIEWIDNLFYNKGNLLRRYKELKNLVDSREYQSAIENPEISCWLSKRYRAVLCSRDPGIILLYKCLSSLRQNCREGK